MTTHQHIRTAVAFLAMVALTFLALIASGLALPAQAAATGAVTGVVSLDGKPVKGLRVQLQQSTDDGDVYDPIAADTTDSKGRYSFSSFPVGDSYRYNVLVTDASYKVVKARRAFEDHSGQMTRNVTVKKAATLVGKVTRQDGVAPTQTRVHLDGPDDEIGTPDTTILSYADTLKPAADGTFTARGLPAGTYGISFTDTSKTYLGQCYDNVLPADPGEQCYPDETPGATLTKIAGGATRTLKAQVLSHEANHITGTVTDTSGHPVPGVRIQAVPDGEDFGLEQAFSQPGTGNFKIAWFNDGRYRLLVEPTTGPWARQWFDGRTTQAGATTFDIAGTDATGVHVTLKSRATVKATLTPGTGTARVAVDVTREATGGKPSGTVTVRWGSISRTVSLVDGKGTATLTGLPKGKRQITVTYSGTATTAAATQLFYVTVA